MVSAQKTALSGRLALFIGFGGLLVIMAVSGLDALRVLRQFRQRDGEIRQKFLFRNRVLNDIRSAVYLSGTYVRDYLLDPDAERAIAYGASLAQVRQRMETDLAAYAQQLSATESAQHDALRGEIDQYWATIQPVLQWDAGRRKADGYAFLRGTVFPRRTAMLDIAGHIADLNEQQLKAGNAQASQLLGNFQTRLAVTLFAGLALGLGMAIVSARRILDLEQRAEARYLETAEARKQLASLSAKLVDAQESERRSLSRELHDEVGQALSAVLVEMRNLQTGLGHWPVEQTRQQAELIKGLVEGGVRVVRNMALLLRPSMLDDLGLVPALRWQARETSKRTSIDVTVAAELESEEMPDEYKTCIYRVVQEALHNCSRHAQATAVRIRVHRRGDELLLSIQDDGKGFDVQNTKGLGLLGIEERVAQLNGRCSIESKSGMGTILSVSLPLVAQQAASR